MENNNNTTAIYLNKLHKDILSIMDEIDSLCRNNGLKYYLIGGTLLGAIRHKGFIPWDDDLDIVMPRKEMEKLLQIIDGDSNSKFKVEWHTINPKYGLLFSKICLKDTLFDEGKRVYPVGIFVDIFPLDYSGAYSAKMEQIKKKIQRLNYISTAKSSTCRIKFTSLCKSVLAWKSLFYRCKSVFFSNRKCFHLIEKTSLSASKYGKTHYANFGSQYSIKKQTMPIEWYGEGAELEFEGRMYKVPTEYIKVITSIFGPNYMQLPPENKRRTHYPVHVKFSDGTEMTFEKPKHRVGVNDW